MSKPPTQGEQDLDLMRRVASGDETAVEVLYDRFSSLVFRLAYQAMPTRAEAEDAVQEIFVRLWRTADRFDPKRAALVTWVMLISRRHLVDKLRRSRARVRAAGLEESASVGSPPSESERYDRDERFEGLMERVNGLPDLQRTVIVRAYLGGQTLRQIGEELGVPLGTIKSALSRALLRLRERASEELA